MMNVDLLLYYDGFEPNDRDERPHEEQALASDDALSTCYRLLDQFCGPRESEAQPSYDELVEHDGDHSRKEGQTPLDAEALLSCYGPVRQ